MASLLFHSFSPATMSVLISSFFVGGYTDTTRRYYGVVMTLLVVGAGFLARLILTAA